MVVYHIFHTSRTPKIIHFQPNCISRLFADKVRLIFVSIDSCVQTLQTCSVKESICKHVFNMFWGDKFFLFERKIKRLVCQFQKIIFTCCRGQCKGQWLIVKIIIYFIELSYLLSDNYWLTVKHTFKCQKQYNNLNFTEKQKQLKPKHK